MVVGWGRVRLVTHAASDAPRALAAAAPAIRAVRCRLPLILDTDGMLWLLLLVPASMDGHVPFPCPLAAPASQLRLSVCAYVRGASGPSPRLLRPPALFVQSIDGDGRELRHSDGWIDRFQPTARETGTLLMDRSWGVIRRSIRSIGALEVGGGVSDV